jgi:hypothetical protein
MMFFLELPRMVRLQNHASQRFPIMHRQQLRIASLASLISMGLWSSGFAVAHGPGGGNSNAGQGAGFHSSHTGRGCVHHGDAGHGARGASARNHGGWIVPGYGFFFASIPAYCKLVYWEGVPYYYADDVYYEWSGTAGAYEQVQPPVGLAESVNNGAAALRDLFVFPNGAQSIEQLERDREECQRWAAEQIGIHPTVAAKRADYLRADGACLEARDYSVE